ncbi:MAG: flagellar basal body protein, partial [Planctomycetota bacterium]|nr:flagellar basal body protein [Planctomycetota bacterium]
MSVSASGTLAALHRLDTLSNNLANAETPGFQADFALAMQRPAP